MNKTFSRETYNQSDKISKIEAIKFLNQLGYKSVLSDKELYKKGDFYSIDPNGNKILVEVEVKFVWDEPKWKKECWDTIHIPYRKHESMSSIFIMFNHDFSSLATIDMKEILTKGEIIKKPTKYSDEDENGKKIEEDFFSLPYTNFTFYIKKENDRWSKIKKVKK